MLSCRYAYQLSGILGHRLLNIQTFDQQLTNTSAHCSAQDKIDMIVYAVTSYL